jgi:hypothetical protein
MMWRTPVTQAFSDALDGRRPATGEVAELVAVATRLCEVAAETAPSPEFRSALRTRLMTEAAPVRMAARPAQAFRSSSSRRSSGVRGWAAVFAAMMATTFGAGMAAASADTIPGDTLYPVKRVLENSQFAIRYSDSSRGSFRLELATERLSEVDQMTSVHGTSTQLTSSTFAEFQRQANLGSDALLRSYLSNDSRDDLVTLNRFSAMSAHQLADLRGRLSAAEIEHAENLLDDVATQSIRMCPTCEGSTAKSVSSSAPSTQPTDAPTTTNGSAGTRAARTSGTASASASDSTRGATDQPPVTAGPPASVPPSPKLSEVTPSTPPPVADLVQKTVVDPLKPLKDSAALNGLGNQHGKTLDLPGQD